MIQITILFFYLLTGNIAITPDVNYLYSPVQSKSSIASERFIDNGSNKMLGTEENDNFFSLASNNILGKLGDDRLDKNLGNDELSGGRKFAISVGENDYISIDLSKFKKRAIPIPGVDNLIKERPFLDNTFEGGSGADKFVFLNGKDDRGRLFVKGQLFARILDFNPSEGDKIFLPGSPINYEAFLYGEKNEDTMIMYREHSEIEITPIIQDTSINPHRSLKIQDQTAIVAVLENIIARDLLDDFYEFLRPD